MAETKIQPIPGVHNLATDVQAFAQPVKQAVEVLLGRAGDPLDAALTLRKFRQLKLGSGSSGSGGATGGGGGGTVVIPGGTYVPDLTPPPAPANLTVTSGFATIFLEWDDTPYTQGHGHAYTEVWRASEDMRGNAVLLGSSPGTIYVDAVGNSAGPFYYWVRFKTRDGVVGPFNATAGVEGSTSPSPAYLLTLLSGAITSSQLSTALTTQLDKIDGQQIAIEETSTIVDGLSGQYTVKIDNNGYVSGFGLASTPGIDGTPYSDFQIRADRFSIVAPGQTKVVPFTVLTTPTMINGVEVPAGTYIDAAYLRLLVVNNAQIGTAAIDDAKIANLSAAKLTAGDGTIGGRLKSTFYVPGLIGWQIHPDGTAEFNNVTVRGTVYATNGVFQGTLIGGGASDFPVGTGMWSGYTGGIYKWRVGKPGGAGAEWDGYKFTIYGKDGSPIFVAGDGNGDSPTQGVIQTNGAGVNAIYNTGKKLQSTDVGWTARSNSPNGLTGGFAYGFDDGSKSLSGEVSRKLMIGSSGINAYYTECNTLSQVIPVDGGGKVEASVYVGSDAGAASELDIVWLDANGNVISTEVVGSTATVMTPTQDNVKWIDVLAGDAKIAAQSAINAGHFGYRLSSGLPYNYILYYDSYVNNNGYCPVITSVGNTIRVAMGRSSDTPDTIDVYDLNCTFIGQTKKNSIESRLPAYATSWGSQWCIGVTSDGSLVTFKSLNYNSRPLTNGNPAQCEFKIGTLDILPMLPVDRRILLAVLATDGKSVFVITAPSSASSGSDSGDQWHVIEWDGVAKSASFKTQGTIAASDYWNEYALTGIYARSTSMACVESDLKHIWYANGNGGYAYCYEINNSGVMSKVGSFVNQGVSYTPEVANGGGVSYDGNNGGGTVSVWADGGLCVVITRMAMAVFSRSAGITTPFNRSIYAATQPRRGGMTVDMFDRIGKVTTAPNNAARAYLAVRALPTDAASTGIITPRNYFNDVTGTHKVSALGLASIVNDWNLGTNVMKFGGSFSTGGAFVTDDSGFDFGTGDFSIKITFKSNTNKPFYLLSSNRNSFDGFSISVNNGNFYLDKKTGSVSTTALTFVTGSVCTLDIKREAGMLTITSSLGGQYSAADTNDYKITGKLAIGGTYPGVGGNPVNYDFLDGYVTYIDVRKGNTQVFGFNSSSKKYVPPYQTYGSLSGFDATCRHLFYQYGYNGPQPIVNNKFVGTSGYSSGIYTKYNIDDFAFGSSDFTIRIKFNLNALPTGSNLQTLVDHSHQNTVWWKIAVGTDGMAFFKTSGWTLTCPTVISPGVDNVIEVSRTGATTSIKVNGESTTTVSDGLVYTKSATSSYPFWVGGEYVSNWLNGNISTLLIKKGATQVLSFGEIAYPAGAPTGTALDPSVPTAPALIKDGTGRHAATCVQSATAFSDGFTLDGDGDWVEVGNNMADYNFGQNDYKIKVVFAPAASKAGTLLSCTTAAGDGFDLWFDVNGELWYTYAANTFKVAPGQINLNSGIGVQHTLEIERVGGAINVTYDGVVKESNHTADNASASISVSAQKLYVGAKVINRDSSLDFYGKIYLVEITNIATKVLSLAGEDQSAAATTGSVVFTRAFMAKAGNDQTLLSTWSEGSPPSVVSPTNPITPDNIDSIIDPSTMDALVRITNENRSRRLALKVIGGAYIDDLSIGTAHIKDLSVDTIKIKDEAVTAPRFSESSSSIVLPALDGGALIPILTLPAVNANSAPVALFICVGQYDPWWEAVYPYTPVLCRDGVPIVSLDTPNANASHMAQMFFDQSPGASPVYSIQIPVWNANPLGATYSGYRSILALAVKK